MYINTRTCVCVYSFYKETRNLIYLQDLPKFKNKTRFISVSWSNAEVKNLAFFFSQEQETPHSFHASQKMTQFPVR